MRNSDTSGGRRRFPAALRGGFAVLGAGLALDVALHLTAALTAGSAPHDGGVATAIHGLVLAGMAVTFAGLLQVAFRPQGTVTRKETR